MGSAIPRPSYKNVDILYVTSGLGARMGGIGLLSARAIDALMKRMKVEVVTSHPRRSRAARALTTSAKLLAAATRRPRLVVYEHVGLASLHPWLPGFRRLPHVVFLLGVEVRQVLSTRQRRGFEAAGALIAISHQTASEAKKHNPWLPPAQIVHPGVSVPPELSNVEASAPVSILVSRAAASERYKGHDEVLDAWPEIRAAVPDGRFVAIGGGDDVDRLRQRVVDENLEGVDFTGFVTDDAKDRWLRSARVGYALGRNEGFGLANVECAAYGVPLIGLAGTVLEELFPQDGDVDYIDSLNPRAIAASTIRLFRDPTFAADRGARVRQRVLERFTIEAFEERLLAVIEPLLEDSA